MFMGVEKLDFTKRSCTCHLDFGWSPGCTEWRLSQYVAERHLLGQDPDRGGHPQAPYNQLSGATSQHCRLLDSCMQPGHLLTAKWR